MIDAKFALRRIVAQLPRFRYRFASEVDLHAGIAQALNASGISFQQEHRVNATERFDFFCEGGVVIEAKIDGSMPAAMRQAERYARLPEVSAVVLAAATGWINKTAGAHELHGKPIHLVRLQPQAF